MATTSGFLAAVVGSLRGGGATVTADDGTLAFPSVLGRTHVQLPGPDEVQVTTPLALREPPDLPWVSGINSLAALSALVKDEKTGAVTLSTRVRCEEGVSERILAAFVASTALLQAPTMLGTVKLLTNQPSDRLDIAARDEAIDGTESDFEHAQRQLKDIGHLSFADAKGLTAELGWSRDEHTATLGHRTNLLEFKATLVHPVLGRGLAYRLKMPVVLAPEQVAGLANALNHWEMNGDLPSCPGAWGRAESDTLAFSGFEPTFCYAPGFAVLLAVWLVRKHNSATWLVKGILERENEA